MYESDGCYIEVPSMFVWIRLILRATDRLYRTGLPHQRPTFFDESCKPKRQLTKKCTRIATLPFLEIGCDCGVTLVLRLVSLARNRVILGVMQ